MKTKKTGKTTTTSKKPASRVPSKELTAAQVQAKLKIYAKRWGVSAAEAQHLTLQGFINRQDALDRYASKAKPKAKAPKRKAAAASPGKVARKPKAAAKPKAARKPKAPKAAAAPAAEG